MPLKTTLPIKVSAPADRLNWTYVAHNQKSDQRADKENVVGIAMNVIRANFVEEQPDNKGPSGFQDEPDPYAGYRVYVGYGNCNLDPRRGPYNQ